MNFENILSTYEDGITTITINRPKKLNALNKATIKELHEAIKQAEKDRNTRVILITGSGEKAFVAGADISEFSDYSVSQGERLAAQG
ncbi:MAG: enoyl-CoA hydratase/isomerase family protein, partial [Bacteroidia bacterium]|nr:enoyl-CoA hydratase/isomerase family protein [Bacteroidia bacterium]